MTVLQVRHWRLVGLLILYSISAGTFNISLQLRAMKLIVFINNTDDILIKKAGSFGWKKNIIWLQTVWMRSFSLVL